MTDETPSKFRQRLLAMSRVFSDQDRRVNSGYRASRSWEERFPWEKNVFVLGSRRALEIRRDRLHPSSQARLDAYTKSWLERKRKSQEDHKDLNKEKKNKSKGKDLNKEKKNKSKEKKPKEEEEKKKKKRKAEGKTKKRKLSPETPPLKNHNATAEQDIVKGFHKEKIINSEAVQDDPVVIFKRFPNVKITSEAVQDDQDVLRF